MPAPLPAHTGGSVLTGAALSRAVSLGMATTRVSTGPSGCLHPAPVPGFGPKQTEVRGNLSIDSAGLGAKQHCAERLGHKAERQRGPMPTHKRFLSASRRALTQPLTGSPRWRKLSRRSRATMGKASGRRRESSEQQRCWLLRDVSTEQGSSLRLFIFTR